MIRVSGRFAAQVRFRSPTGNLACWLSDGVICRATVHTWTSHAPDAQTECQPASRTSGIQLGERGLEERSDCYDVAKDPTMVLAYGHGLDYNGVRCISEERGITCARTADHVGFSISREALAHTPWDSPLMRVEAVDLGEGGTTVYPAGFELSFLVSQFADCRFESGGVLCAARTDARPPQPRDCGPADNVVTARLTGSGPGALVYACQTGTNGGEELVTSSYAVQVGDLRCSVVGAALRCEHLGGSKHGFEVDAHSFRGF